MQAGRLIAGELLFTRTQAFCKLNKSIPQADGTIFNFMIVAGKDAGKFAELPDTFEGTTLRITLGEYANLEGL